jgi:hypothetical protein
MVQFDPFVTGEKQERLQPIGLQAFAEHISGERGN